MVERANKAELRPQEQRDKTESCRENLWNEIQLIELTEIDARTESKGVGKLGWFMSDMNRNIPTT